MQALLEQGLLGLGYKTFMWHQRPDGTQPTFSGHNGQMVIVTRTSFSRSKLVLKLRESG
eukprot:COSAG04_NODE_198_length_20599_cov_6.484137_15_plen_59_part_00